MRSRNRLMPKLKSLGGYSRELEILNFLVSTVQNLRLISKKHRFST